MRIEWKNKKQTNSGLKNESGSINVIGEEELSKFVREKLILSRTTPIENVLNNHTSTIEDEAVITMPENLVEKNNEKQEETLNLV